MPRDRETFLPDQSRAARGLLAWSRAEAAQRAGLEVEALELYEAEQGGLAETELERLGRAYYGDGSGVIATRDKIAGRGVRWAKPRTPFAIVGVPVGRGGPSPQDPFNLLPLASRSRAAGQLVRQVARALDMQTRLGWSRGW